MRDLPMIISVDDHVIEPATVWSDRLPAKYLDVGPRIVRAPVKEMEFIGGKFAAIPGEPGDPGEAVDWWFYEDLRRPLLRLDTAVGYAREDITLKGITYADMRP
ncbi:MAG: amidohydrolase, partial [Acidimicrobiales bacterium]